MTISTFSAGLEDWTTTNGTQIFDTAEGDPAGSLRGIEGGTGVWYFTAPDAYLGDRSDFYGGSISFDMKQDVTTSQFDDIDIVLSGAGVNLVLDMGDNPGTDWTAYSVNLALGGGWRVNSLSGSVASEAQIRAVLVDLQSLSVRGEFVNGTTGDASNLDNFLMVKEPATPPDYIGVKVDSAFDTGIDGWSFVADVKAFDWVDTGGNPGGYVEAVDYATGAVWYFVAPVKYLGDKSAYSGGVLEFDLKQSSIRSQFDDDDVVITGGGKSIALSTEDNPGLDWTHYAVSLDTGSDWRLGSVSGDAATQAEIDAVLADVTSLWIRGEYVVGGDTGGLDNVQLSPDPSAVRVLSDTTLGLLVSNHDTLGDALAASEDGNVVQINKATAVTADSYVVTDNRLTVTSNRAVDAELRLDGVTSLTLSGDNDLGATGDARNNTLIGSDGDNTLKGLRGSDLLIGGAGADLLAGGKRGDKLLGENGADVLLGQDGFDRLKGGAGRDLLDGGVGNDRFFGGLGADTFRFSDGSGSDKIFKFKALSDDEKIDLSDMSEITGFADLSGSHMTQVGADVVIDATGGDVITLVGVHLADLDAADFLF
ncbi:laminin B domain-containing protein [Antarcticimicrobium luteum]|uniref:Laminin IV type A domain-containing protein n=1 Tax=Antarcticimicrobium luteum TaxID=2547397 RepID=A0A4R5UQ41_9RHOB|nr:laminin B domain-containing protein [Antarcticimicrobium luteum]TDK41159.1 hypothetical protein E1832_20925 [Antarcticimicrobium luteum]